MVLTLEIAFQNSKSVIFSYPVELAKYISDLSHPLEILEIADKRKEITDVLLELTTKPQLSLFNDNVTALDNLFDNLLQLKKEKRPLYKKFEKEINGKTRELVIAQKPLDIFLRYYVNNIMDKAQCHQQAHGAEKNWSPKESIKTHLPIGKVLSFDLSKAWKNTHLQYIFDFYYGLIYNKIADKKQSMQTAGFLATISVVYYKDAGYALPQGSPIGSKLFNRLLYPIDELIYDYSQERGLTYTRWVDDFTISSKHKDAQQEELTDAIKIVQEYFPISKEKTYLQSGNVIYLLGHKIIKNNIFKAAKKELESRCSINV